MDGSSGSSSQSAKDLALNLSKDVTRNITMWMRDYQVKELSICRAI